MFGLSLIETIIPGLLAFLVGGVALAWIGLWVFKLLVWRDILKDPWKD